MPIEKVTAQIVAEVDKNSIKQSEQEMQRLKSPISIKMAVDLGTLRRELELVKAQIKTAEKAGDTTLSLKLRGDAELLKKSITQANRELINFVRTGDKEISVLGKMFDKVGMDINSGFGKVLSAISGSFVQTVSSGLNSVGLAATSTGVKFNQMAEQSRAAGLSLSSAFAPTALAAIGAGFLALGVQALSLGDKYEQSAISFRVMLGSAEESKKLLADLSAFAATTPFEIGGIRDSAKQLLAFGIGARDLIPTLKILGDVASGTGVPLGQIAYAYGQVRTANQLYASELRQFTQAGVPLLAELARMYGVTEAEAKKMVESGVVGFGDVEKAFTNMTGEGGKFFNLMSEQSTTLTGKISNLKDSFNIFLEEVGFNMIGFAKGFIDALLFILTESRKTAAGLKGIFLLISLSVQLAISKSVGYFKAFISSLVIMGLSIKSVAGFITDNFGTLADNVGIAFRRVPALISKALNSGLKKIEDFINSAGSQVNSFAKGLGFEGDLVQKITFKPIFDDGGVKEAFKAFKDINTGEITKEFQNINSALEREQSTREALIKRTEEQLSQIIKPSQTGTVDTAFKKEADTASKGAISVENSIGQLNSKLKLLKDRLEGMEIGSAAFNKTKSEIEALEKRIASATKTAEVAKGGGKAKADKTAQTTIKSEEDIQKKRFTMQQDAKEFVKKTLASELQVREESARKSKESIDKIKNALLDYEQVQKQVTEVQKDSSEKIAERYQAISDKIKGLTEDSSRYSIEVQSFANRLGDLAFDSSFNAQTLTAGGLDIPIEDIRNYLKNQREVVALQKEQAVAKENTTKAEIDKAGLSETERIILERDAKLKDLEAEKLLVQQKTGIKEAEAAGLLAIEQDRYLKSVNAITAYKETVDTIENQITLAVRNQTAQRIVAYEREEAAARKLLMTRMSLSSGTTGEASSTTVNNTPTIIVNATVGSNVDISNLSKTLAKEVQLSAKGINK